MEGISIANVAARVTTRDTIVKTTGKGGDGICFLLFIVRNCKYQLSKMLGFTSRLCVAVFKSSLSTFISE